MSVLSVSQKHRIVNTYDKNFLPELPAPTERRENGISYSKRNSRIKRLF